MQEVPMAFPSVLDGEEFDAYQGAMTLRDYFAGQALVKLAEKHLSESYEGEYSNVKESQKQLIRLITNISYAYADAMIKERGK